jgi:hypothetical protein
LTRGLSPSLFPLEPCNLATRPHCRKILQSLAISANIVDQTRKTIFVDVIGTVLHYGDEVGGVDALTHGALDVRFQCLRVDRDSRTPACCWRWTSVHCARILPVQEVKCTATFPTFDDTGQKGSPRSTPHNGSRVSQGNKPIVRLSVEDGRPHGRIHAALVDVESREAGLDQKSRETVDSPWSTCRCPQSSLIPAPHYRRERRSSEQSPSGVPDLDRLLFDDFGAIM